MQKLLTPRQKKAQETKDKILSAAVKLIEEYGFDALTIKNICESSGISNGSFFHYFKTKDDMLSYYLVKSRQEYVDRLPDKPSNGDFRQAVIDIYTDYVAYCKNAGIAFVSRYYSTRNQALNNHSPYAKERDIISYDDVLEELRNAQKNGFINDNLRPESISDDICAIIKGIIFDWCVSGGILDMAASVDRLLGIYFNGIVNDTYAQQFGYYKVKHNW